jgi:hypothetical protein
MVSDKQVSGEWMVPARAFFSYRGEDAQIRARLQLSLAGPDEIASWSYGEIKSLQTINERTGVPARDGLFDARIFGPIKDYECSCGKYKNSKYKGIICEKCSVEVTLSRVRRERMAHIELAAPVVHVWFLKSLPSRIGVLLNMRIEDLERILHFDCYVVLEPGVTALEKHQLLSADEYLTAQQEFGDGTFTAQIGAQAIREMLEALDPEQLATDLRKEAPYPPSLEWYDRAERLAVIESLIKSGARPEWMILTRLPVIPPDLRPPGPADLNALYRRVIGSNNRMKRLIARQAPGILIHNANRALQKAVDDLLENGRPPRLMEARLMDAIMSRSPPSIANMLKPHLVSEMRSHSEGDLRTVDEGTIGQLEKYVQLVNEWSQRAGHELLEAPHEIAALAKGAGLELSGGRRRISLFDPEPRGLPELAEPEPSTDVGPLALPELAESEPSTDLTAAPAEFVATERLAELFHRGLSAHHDILCANNRATEEAPAIEWARRVLPGRILEVIASRARRMQLGTLERRPLAVAGTFDYGFVLELSEHVPFRIDEGTAFFAQLHRDLTAHLRAGGSVCGRWGQLVIDQEQISFELNGSASRTSLQSSQRLATDRGTDIAEESEDGSSSAALGG